MLGRPLQFGSSATMWSTSAMESHMGGNASGLMCINASTKLTFRKAKPRVMGCSGGLGGSLWSRRASSSRS